MHEIIKQFDSKSIQHRLLRTQSLHLRIHVQSMPSISPQLPQETILINPAQIQALAQQKRSPDLIQHQTQHRHPHDTPRQKGQRTSHSPGSL